MPTIISRTFTELGHSLKDAYGHVFHGDDAGNYTNLVFIARASPVLISSPSNSSSNTEQKYVEKFNLGLTFIQIDDRAYVRTVEPNSEAALAGIQSQYCLQLAVIPEQCRHLPETQFDHTLCKYALQCEQKGMRTSFDKLRTMFENCIVLPEEGGKKSIDEIFISNDGHQYHDLSNHDSLNVLSATKKKISLSQKLRSTTQGVVGGLGKFSALSMDNICSSFSPAVSDNEVLPIVMVFRKTQKRTLPNNIHVGLPSFRLDDECERAASIIRRLAPTVDTKREKDAWDELFMQKNKNKMSDNNMNGNGGVNNGDDIQIMSRDMEPEEMNTVEASTIRGVIKSALGLAFIRTSKVVVGLSFHFGSGIVVSRLPDGSWSAPSAIGMYGAGLGFQFGLEVADYIFVIQTDDALEHFRKGGNYTIGGNMGAALGGMGREAYGAASLSDKKDKAINLAPIVAYAKSQGLYFGVSLEGSKIFVREDINHRTYQFLTGKECSTDEILSGMVPPPREAEILYATLHNVEFAHEIDSLPRPPEVLKNDLHRNWCLNALSGGSEPLIQLTELSDGDSNNIDYFESQFKTFLYEGVSVQRIIPGATGRANESLERRTLWLMLPEEGSFRLGFLTKTAETKGNTYADDDESVLQSVPDTYHDGDSVTTFDTRSTFDTRGTLDTKRQVKGHLSSKFSIDLTDISAIQRYSTTNAGTLGEVEGARCIKIEDVHGKRLSFIANNVPESVVLFCGIKLLIEKETSRLGRRGGKPINQIMDNPEPVIDINSDNCENVSSTVSPEMIGKTNSNSSIEYKSSESSQDDPSAIGNVIDPSMSVEYSIGSSVKVKVNTSKKSETKVQSLSRNNIEKEINGAIVPNSRERKSQETAVVVPISSQIVDNTIPRYVQGQVVHKEFASNVTVPLPLPLCKALFLDNNSPLIKQWEIDRGDTNYSYGRWKFKKSSQRSTYNPELTEMELVAGGRMAHGYRLTTFNRVRKGQNMTMSEILVVEIDENDKLVFTISERLPRRGFAVKVNIIVRPSSSVKSSDVSIIGEFVPLGKNTSDQATVHRAFLLMLDEVEDRYGGKEHGLLSGLMQMNFPSNGPPMGIKVIHEPKQISPNSIVSDDFLTKAESQSGERDKTHDFDETRNRQQASFPSNRVSTTHHNEAEHRYAELRTPQRRKKKISTSDRPATPSMKERMNHQMYSDQAKPSSVPSSNDFFEMPSEEDVEEETIPIKVDVRPLPKIRLDLMPSPREQDEDEDEI